ncbi:ABC transporter permease/substrate-binding protein [Xylocopilactobacillus apicola]|uniref:Glycine/betaine ABC transporter permease n=1 Tax=Xylocopilactobacillus apicola TaxID=2932184 RepID=A0AAU9DJW6_9LACO|nr:ABC transporter permease/substrate-binding protein [Xylocopilactobacillus apicola]BDR58801.1 glycine/betaine ABC transporter permease [Xylocopilactobacillus apicola]
MDNLISTFNLHRGELVTALWQHLNISLISLLIAIVIAVPLAIVVVNHQKIANFLLQVTGVFQTIPSLALLGLLIPFVGIGNTPAIIALVIYALLPIFQNTYLGLTSIDPILLEAADAFGMSRWRRLFKVELPLSRSAIISGIRTALVMIIGTATLAALIGAGGLGTLILLGIDRNDMALTLIGAIAAALLTIIFSAIIRLLQKVRFRYTIGVFVAIAAIFVGSNVYQSVISNEVRVVIAGKLGSEPEILINMYKDLIEDENPHVKVELKPNFGQTSFLFNALKSEQIDLYPEFSGTVTESLVKVKKGILAKSASAEEIYQVAKRNLEDQFKMTYLAPMKYNNTYALVVKEQFAKEHHLKKISDLGQVSTQLNGGFDLEFLNRADGFAGLKKDYHFSFPTQSLDASLRYLALNKGKVNITNGYTTDPQIVAYKLRVLDDDQHFFAIYQGAPLMNDKFAKKNPKVVKSLNKLQGRITNEEMQEMNRQVNFEKKSAASVARSYLVKHHLLKEAK